MDLYKVITDKIIKKLEKGTVPWRKPFQSAEAVNWVTQKPYRGINALLLDGGEYATFKQINDAGGKVKKGEKSELIIFWELIEVEDKEVENEEKQNKEEKETERKTNIIPFMRYYRVFEINEQAEGLETKRDIKKFKHDPIEKVEKVLEKYQEPKFTENIGKAYYRPIDDTINVPPKEDFENIHNYYSTVFHEIVHSTGHKKRLNRKGIAELATFGDSSYSKEELVAEIGASFLCGKTGIINKTIDNSAAYIQSWLRVLENDKRLVVQASQQAQKAVDYILGVEWD